MRIDRFRARDLISTVTASIMCCSISAQCYILLFLSARKYCDVICVDLLADCFDRLLFQGTYASIHSSGFRDFLLKPELLRAIVDCGFEHPSEGN